MVSPAKQYFRKIDEMTEHQVRRLLKPPKGGAISISSRPLKGELKRRGEVLPSPF